MFIPKNLRRHFEAWDWRSVKAEQLEEVAAKTGKDVWEVLKYWIAYLDEQKIICLYDKEKE